jgi:hypothetical protein
MLAPKFALAQGIEIGFKGNPSIEKMAFQYFEQKEYQDKNA